MNKLTKEQKNELDKVYRHFANNENEIKQGVYTSIIKIICEAYPQEVSYCKEALGQEYQEVLIERV